MSHQLRQLRGLPDDQLRPRKRTCGAALVVGMKDPKRGFPINKDRFYIVETTTQERKAGRKIEYRPPDPRFRYYHDLEIEQRRKFYGMIIHHYEPEFFDFGLMTYRGDSGRSGVTNPQHKGPWCHGDGKTAERWNGSAYAPIDLCGAGCPFYDGENEPRMTTYFQPRWPGFLFGEWGEGAERPLMKLASRGRLARETFAGMLADVRAVAEPLKIDISSWFGLPFTVSLGEGSSAAKRTRYPTLKFALDGDPLAWVRWQSRQFRGLLDQPSTRVLALGAASDPELDAEEQGADHLMITPGRGPATKPAAVIADPPANDAIEGEIIEAKPKGMLIGEKIALAARGVLGLEDTDELPPGVGGKIAAELRKAGLLAAGERWYSDPPPATLEAAPWEKIREATAAALKEKS